MRVRRVSWQPFRLGLTPPLQTAAGTLAQRDGMLITIESDDGRVGLGEASPFGASGPTGASLTASVADAAGRLLGRPVDELWAGPRVSDVPPVACGIESALADLLSADSGRPLWQWLRAEHGLVADVVELPANALIDGEEPDRVGQEVRLAVDQGFRTVKLKVGRDSRMDCERLAAARAAGGEGLEIRIDANGAWNESEAAANLTRFAEYGVSLCEQPVAAGGEAAIECLSRVRRVSPVAVAADESCRSMAELDAILAFGAADAIIVKPTLTGLREAIAMLERARKEGLLAIVTTAFESGIGTSLAAHVAALLPEPVPACGLATLSRLGHDFTEGAPILRSGNMVLSLSPGLGVRIDDARLRASEEPGFDEVMW